MCRRSNCSLLIFIQFSSLLLSPEGKISSTQREITKPTITVPTQNFTIPTMNPTVSNPDTPPMSPPFTTSPPSSGVSWCVARQSASQADLQAALDFACANNTTADCSDIQPGGRCYNPNTITHHASYAINSYFLKNPIPTSCDFSGNAFITNTDPSTDTCLYPSTSTSASILNTTYSNGSRVFGAGPIPPSISKAAAQRIYYFLLTFLMICSADVHYHMAKNLFG